VQSEAVKVEIKKRNDGKYNVYQEFTINSAVRQGKEALFYCDVADEEKDGKEVFDSIRNNKFTVHKRIARWITVAVLQNKKLATEYCKKTWGRQCFKEKEGMSVTYV
tara:strand:+ start:36 stop:356 length:321 start_codon:yes stop_codon:yes gene_type:complete